MASSASAQMFETEGRAYFPADISQIEACDNAYINAKKSAMSLAGLERGQFFTLDICSESDKGTNCSLIQESISYYDGGYVASEQRLAEKLTETTPRECIVNGKFEVRIFKDKPDVNFVLDASLNQRNFVSGQEVIIEGRVSPKAHISLLSFDPKTNTLSRIVPNDFDREIIIEDSFQLPSKAQKRRYSLEAYIPENTQSEEIAEFMVLLATKKKFDLLDKQTSSNFYKRLDEFGRQNWRKKDLGYTIYRK